MLPMNSRIKTIYFPYHWNPSLTNLTNLSFLGFLCLFFFHLYNIISKNTKNNDKLIGNEKSKGFVFLKKVDTQ